MERPGLRDLLADVEKGLIDTVVVYKVDRLTRSLADFARMVQVFDAKKVSFVSVTQSFNTTTSMGRLTLNVLLSFAQFEREVTGERIRDKIAASKKKGMWMGGNVPLGYDQEGCTLAINPAEAETVRMIFQRYLEVGSANRLVVELNAKGIRSKSRITPTGMTVAGSIFQRWTVYHLLTNHHYRGLIRHKDQLYPGMHPAIVDQDLFEAVQQLIAKHRVKRNTQVARPAKARLIGRLVLEDGTVLTPTFAYGRSNNVYRYNVDARPANAERANVGPPRRISAAPLEEFLLETLRRLSGRHDAEWGALDPMLLRVDVRADETDLVLDWQSLSGTAPSYLTIDQIRPRLFDGEQLLSEPGRDRRLRLRIPRRLQFRGGKSWLMGNEERAAVTQTHRPNLALIAGLKKAHATLAIVGINLAAQKIDANARSPSQSYRRKLCLLALLSPDLQRAVLQGQTPRTVTLNDLLTSEPPLIWSEQADWFGRPTRRA
jgi:DNA invertase Pin-like site-specific DNA recombinase